MGAERPCAEPGDGAHRLRSPLAAAATAHRPRRPRFSSALGAAVVSASLLAASALHVERAGVELHQVGEMLARNTTADDAVARSLTDVLLFTVRFDEDAFLNGSRPLSRVDSSMLSGLTSLHCGTHVFDSLPASRSAYHAFSSARSSQHPHIVPLAAELLPHRRHAREAAERTLAFMLPAPETTPLAKSLLDHDSGQAVAAASLCELRFLEPENQRARYPGFIASRASDPAARFFGTVTFSAAVPPLQEAALIVPRSLVAPWATRAPRVPPHHAGVAGAAHAEGVGDAVHSLHHLSKQALAAYGVDPDASPEEYIEQTTAAGTARSHRQNVSEVGAAAGRQSASGRHLLSRSKAAKPTTAAELVRSGAWSTPELQKKLHPLASQLDSEQESVLSLLQVVSKMKTLSKEGLGAQTGTIFEMVIDPLINAISKLLPKITFKLLKEPLAVALTSALEDSLLNALTKPALSSLDPEGGNPPKPSEIKEAADAMKKAKEAAKEGGSGSGDGSGSGGGGDGSGSGVGSGSGGGTEGTEGTKETPGTPGNMPKGGVDGEGDTRSPAGGSCQSSKDCGKGLECNGRGICAMGAGGGDPCSVAQDCSPPLHCVRQTCQETEGDVGSRCKEDAECRPTLHCDTDLGQCQPMRGSEGGPCTATPDCDAGLDCLAGTCGRGSKQPGESCARHAQCVMPLACVDRKCQPGMHEEGQACDTPLRCRLGLDCVDGACTRGRDGREGAKCSEAADCEPPLSCSEGQCRAGTVKSGGKCPDDQHCGAGLLCLDHRCARGAAEEGDSCDSTPQCAFGLLCEGGSCRPGGQRVGSKCDEGSSVGCGKGGALTCALGQCQPQKRTHGWACKADADCGEGLVCAEDGACALGRRAEGEKCSVDADCMHGLDCSGGKCRGGGRGAPCLATPDCDIGLRCEPGVRRCMARGLPSAKCRNDEQCANGLQCNEGRCDGGGEGSPCRLDDDCGRFLLCFHDSQFPRAENATCTHPFNCSDGLACDRPGDAKVGLCKALDEGTPCVKINAEPVEGEFPTDMDCATGQRCVEEQCRSVPRDAQCRGSHDCANGYRCNVTLGRCEPMPRQLVVQPGRCSHAAWVAERIDKKDHSMPAPPPLGYIPAHQTRGDTDALAPAHDVAAAVSSGSGSGSGSVARAFSESATPITAQQQPHGSRRRQANDSTVEEAWHHAPRRVKDQDEGDATAKNRRHGGTYPPTSPEPGPGTESPSVFARNKAAYRDNMARAKELARTAEEEEEEGAAGADALLETGTRAGASASVQARARTRAHTRAKASAKAGAKARDPASTESGGAGLAEDLSKGISDAVSEEVVMAVREPLGMSTGEAARRLTVRTTSRRLTSMLTLSLGNTLTHILVELLSRSMTQVSTKELTASLVPSVTHTVAPIVTHALTHSPKMDYYCAHCTKHKMYCEYCNRGFRRDVEYDFYISYYAEYYSQYYTRYYSDHFSKVFTTDYMRRTGRTSTVTTNHPWNHKEFVEAVQGDE